MSGCKRYARPTTAARVVSGRHEVSIRVVGGLLARCFRAGLRYDFGCVPASRPDHDIRAASTEHRKVRCQCPCLLYTSDAADERSSVDLGGRRIIKKKNRKEISENKIEEGEEHDM